MDRKQAADVSTLSKIRGTLQAIACMEGATITKGLACEMEHMAECMDIYIAEKILKDVNFCEDPERPIEGVM